MTMCGRCRRRSAVWELPLGPRICDDCYTGVARTSGLATRIASDWVESDPPEADPTD